MNVDVQALDIDFLFSIHKMCGPSGMGGGCGAATSCSTAFGRFSRVDKR